MTTKRFQSLQPAADMPRLTAMMTPDNGASSASGWFSMKTLSESQAEINIYADIGEGGVTASDFAREIGSIKASNIALRVSSGGGSVFDGVSIFNAIRRHKANVTAYVDGIAASAASFIIMAADRVVMSPHSTLMIHDASGLCFGNAADMQEMGATLDMLSNNIASIYAKKAGGTVEEWRDRMRAETWLTAEETVAMGLADAVDGDEEAARPQTVKAVKNEVPPIDFRKIINEQIDIAADLFAD